MAVQEGPSFKRYAANGIATVYSIPFLLLDDEDLVVTLDGVELTSGFTLTGIGNPTSTATFDVAPSGDLLFLLMVPFQRLNDYQENGDLLSLTLNNDLDRIWLAIKELRRDDQRALSVNPLEPEGIPPLPVAALRQLRVLAFDADGDPIPSNLTLAQLEQQPAVALAAASAAQISANAADASAGAAALSASEALGYRDQALGYRDQAAAYAALLNDPWALQPIGVPVPVFDHITGASAPPTDRAYRYIKLTASDSYNTGLLTGESVTGSAPDVQATAAISSVSSALNGQTVRLINTERRMLRAGSSGTVQADSFKSHTHPVGNGTFSQLQGPTGGSTGGNVQGIYGSAGTSGYPVTATAVGGTETVSKNIGATYYMRII